MLMSWRLLASRRGWSCWQALAPHCLPPAALPCSRRHGRGPAGVRGGLPVPPCRRGCAVAAAGVHAHDCRAAGKLVWLSAAAAAGNCHQLARPLTLNVSHWWLQATQHAACRVRVSVLERRGRRGSKFKVAGAMVLPGVRQLCRCGPSVLRRAQQRPPASQPAPAHPSPARSPPCAQPAQMSSMGGTAWRWWCLRCLRASPLMARWSA